MEGMHFLAWQPLSRNFRAGVNGIGGCCPLAFGHFTTKHRRNRQKEESRRRQADVETCMIQMSVRHLFLCALHAMRHINGDSLTDIAHFLTFSWPLWRVISVSSAPSFVQSVHACSECTKTYTAPNGVVYRYAGSWLVILTALLTTLAS